MGSPCAGLRTDRSCRTWGGADAGECTGRGSLGREWVRGVASCGMGSVLSGLSSRPVPRPVAHTPPVREAEERSSWLLEGRWWEAAMAWAETAHKPSGVSWRWPRVNERVWERELSLSPRSPGTEAELGTGLRVTGSAQLFPLGSITSAALMSPSLGSR